LHTTARTPALNGLDLRDHIDEVRQTAADRGASIDVVYPYVDPTIGSPEKDVERHREAFAALEAIGVTWITVSGATRSPDSTRQFLESFGATYL
jgi:sugar phosphate isomerase/epimerase